METPIKYQRLRWVIMPLTAVIGPFITIFIINYVFITILNVSIPQTNELYSYILSIFGTTIGAVLFCLIVKTVSPTNKQKATLVMVLIGSIFLLFGVGMDLIILKREQAKIILGVMESIVWIVGAFSCYLYLFRAKTLKYGLVSVLKRC